MSNYLTTIYSGVILFTLSMVLPRKFCLNSCHYFYRDVFGTLPNIYGALRDLVPFIQFKNLERHPWRSNTPPWVFFSFFKLCTWC